ncbi:hypothetical protein DFS34DRAFT_651081 [Phlyctochytrium arcticum]|nr:hypothetical protein DFS34DRAFT_651081 [Phlyctochytrium arcticum]
MAIFDSPDSPLLSDSQSVSPQQGSLAADHLTNLDGAHFGPISDELSDKTLQEMYVNEPTTNSSAPASGMTLAASPAFHAGNFSMAGPNGPPAGSYMPISRQELEMMGTTAAVTAAALAQSMVMQHHHDQQQQQIKRQPAGPVPHILLGGQHQAGPMMQQQPAPGYPLDNQHYANTQHPFNSGLGEMDMAKLTKAERKKIRENLRNLTCYNCGTNRTPLWRRTADRQHSLCNACGLYFKQYQTHRPANIRHKSMQQQQQQPQLLPLLQTGLMRAPVTLAPYPVYPTVNLQQPPPASRPAMSTTPATPTLSAPARVHLVMSPAAENAASQNKRRRSYEDERNVELLPPQAKRHSLDSSTDATTTVSQSNGAAGFFGSPPLSPMSPVANVPDSPGVTTLPEFDAPLYPVNQTTSPVTAHPTAYPTAAEQQPELDGFRARIRSLSPTDAEGLLHSLESQVAMLRTHLAGGGNNGGRRQDQQHPTFQQQQQQQQQYLAYGAPTYHHHHPQQHGRHQHPHFSTAATTAH